MTNTFSLTVRTPEAQVLQIDNARGLKVRTEGGQVEILPGHATMVGTILFSKMIVMTEDSEQEYIVQRGMLFVSQEDKSVQVLAYQCKLLQDIEYKSAKEYLEFVEKKLAEGGDLNDFQLQYLENEKIAMVQQVKELEKMEK